LGCSQNNNAVVGDLIERYGGGETAFWYWRQVVAAVLAGFLNEALGHKLRMFLTILAGWAALAVVVNFELLIVFSPHRFWGRWYAYVFLAAGILRFVAAGWIVRRTGGLHGKAAVLGFAGSYLLISYVLLPLLLRPAIAQHGDASVWIVLIGMTKHALMSIALLAGGLIGRQEDSPSQVNRTST